MHGEERWRGVTDICFNHDKLIPSSEGGGDLEIDLRLDCCFYKSVTNWCHM